MVYTWNLEAWALLWLGCAAATAYIRVGRTWLAWWTTLDVTGVKIRPSALSCLSAMKNTLEAFKLRGINLKDTIQTKQLDLQKAFK